MMDLIINGYDYHYAFEQLIRVFMPDIQLKKIFDSPLREGEFILCESALQEGSVRVHVTVNFSDYTKTMSDVFYGEDLYKAGELGGCKMLYRALCEYSGYQPEWGMQTGVRPTKIYFNLLRNNTPQEAVKYLEEELLIQPAKVSLITDVCENERLVMDSSDSKQFSLYVSLPFCPSRCTYCSFISHSYESLKKLIPQYVELLCREIALIATLAQQNHMHLRTVYIGGGTPTVLSTPDLARILNEIERDFCFDDVTEFTIEAGRPDTLSKEKLDLIRHSSVSRITINAQSFQDEVLKNIGRNHTSEEVYQAYQTARKLGFDNINTDLIAGLEGDSVESFLHSVQCAVDLKAENITIHTLALKRSSFLVTKYDTKGKIRSTTGQMIQKANEILRQNNYVPYYMYRQSKSVGNLENTGWALPGKICEYNIFMMEEVQHVFGAGAGAVTRLVNLQTHDIRRIFNYKYPYEYISGFEEMLARKHEAFRIMKKWQKP